MADFAQALSLLLSLLAFGGYIVTFATFARNSRREREERKREDKAMAVADAQWKQKIETELKEIKQEQAEQKEQIREHNNYADLWHKSSEDLAYVRGVLDQLVSKQ